MSRISLNKNWTLKLSQKASFNKLIFSTWYVIFYVISHPQDSAVYFKVFFSNMKGVKLEIVHRMTADYYNPRAYALRVNTCVSDVCSLLCLPETWACEDFFLVKSHSVVKPLMNYASE